MGGEKWRSEDTALRSMARENWEVREGSGELAKTDHTAACTHTCSRSNAESDLETWKVPVASSSNG